MAATSPIRFLRWLLAWLAMAGLYMAFSVSPGLSEYIAAALTAAFATWMTHRLVHCAGLRIGLRWRDLATVWRMPGYLVTGTWEVVQALAKQLFTKEGATSQFAVAPFHLGDRVDPKEAGRRALAVFYTTATPNFVVLGLLDEQNAMLYHQVKPGPVLAMTRALGTEEGPNG